MNGIHSKGSNTLTEQIFNSRLIPFPKELWQNTCSNPNAERFWLGITAAAMLFPRDYESFAGYLAREVHIQADLAEGRLFNERLCAFIEQQTLKNSDRLKDSVTVQPQDLMSAILEGRLPQDKEEQKRLTDEWLFSYIEQLESKFSDVPKNHTIVRLQDFVKAISEGSLLPEREEQTDLEQSKLQRFFFGSPAFFQKHCRWRGFSEKGKGSLAERILQGRICGWICLTMAINEKSLSESIRTAIPFFEEWRNESDEIRDAMPTPTFTNIQNTIWPNFKDVAWLWSALSAEGPVHDGQRLLLRDISFGRDPSPEVRKLLYVLDVHRGCWWGFMDFALKVFELLQKQRKGSFEQKNSRPWRFSFQFSKNELELL